MIDKKTFSVIIYVFINNFYTPFVGIAGNSLSAY